MERTGKGLLIVLTLCALVYAAVRVGQARRASAPPGAAEKAARPSAQGLKEGGPRAASVPPLHLIQGKKTTKIEGKVPVPPPSEGRP